MNWKRGLTRIYAVLWAVLAIGGAVLAISTLPSSSVNDLSSIWAVLFLWAGLCVALPAALLLIIIKWIAAGAAPTAGSRKQSRIRQGLWPQISDADSAKKAAHLGAGAAFWVAGLTAVFAVLGMFNISKMFEGTSLVDAVVFAVIGFFIMKRMSRGAAVAGLAFYIFERVYMSAAKGTPLGLGGIVLVFTLYFIHGVRGTYAYHRFSQATRPPESTMKAA